MTSKTSVASFLMFEGKAEEAVRFYTSLIPNSKIIDMKLYGPNETGPEGTVNMARFTLDGQAFMAIDSPAKHKFNFTPSFSIFVTCETEEQIDAIYKELVNGGSELMPLGNYGFSTKFGWVNDKYGVSWQINLP